MFLSKSEAEISKATAQAAGSSPLPIHTQMEMSCDLFQNEALACCMVHHQLIHRDLNKCGCMVHHSIVGSKNLHVVKFHKNLVKSDFIT